MENTTQHIETILIPSFTTRRRMLNNIIASVKNGYLPESWKDDKENNYQNIVMTYSGYYAMKDDCVMAENAYFHEYQDDGEYVYDEHDEEYIMECNAEVVYTRRGNCFYTHKNNCIATNSI